MRENRSYGSEGGGTELNQSSLPLSLERRCQSAGEMSGFDWRKSSVHLVVRDPGSSCHVGPAAAEKTSHRNFAIVVSRDPDYSAFRPIFSL